MIGLLSSPKRLGQGLVAVGMIGGGVFTGITKAGEMIAGVEAQASGASIALVEVSNVLGARIAELEAELAACDIELALCNGE